MDYQGTLKRRFLQGTRKYFENYQHLEISYNVQDSQGGVGTGRKP